MERLRHLEAYVSDFELMQRFRHQIEREADRLTAYVRQAVTDPLCAIAFLYTEEDLVRFTHVYGWTASARNAVVDELNASADAIWMPADWDVDLDEGNPEGLALQEATALARSLLGDMPSENLDEPETWGLSPAKPFLLDLSAHLNRINWANVGEVTDDFVVWANDHELSELTRKMFQKIAPASAFQEYEDRGWLAWLDENAWPDV